MGTKKIAKFIAAIGCASQATIDNLDSDSVFLSNEEKLAYFGYMNVKFGVTQYQAMNSLHNLGFLSEAAQLHIEEKVAAYEGRPVEEKKEPVAPVGEATTNDSPVGDDDTDETGEADETDLENDENEAETSIGATEVTTEGSGEAAVTDSDPEAAELETEVETADADTNASETEAGTSDTEADEADEGAE